MKQPLAVIVPTRGRPHNAARLAEAFRETDTLNALPVFVADLDDPELGAYQALREEGKIPRLVVPTMATGDGRGMVGALNYAARRYAGLYEAVGFMGDDHLPRTRGWDDQIMDELDALTPRIAYGNDLLQGAALPTAVFMQSRIIRALGFMAPPVLRHLYVDNFWKHLGEQLGGLRYRDDVIIEHIHPAAGKTPMDERYRTVNAAEVDTVDRLMWEDYRDGVGFEAALRSVRQEYGS